MIVILALVMGVRPARAAEGWPKPFSEAQYEVYRTPGMFMNDFRFVKGGDTFYTFFLQVPRCAGKIWADGRSYGVADRLHSRVGEPA